jgi:ribosomal protein S3
MHDEDDFEVMLMQAMECEIEALSQQHQLALQHVARAECLGVEVIMNGRLPSDRTERESLCQEAMRALHRRLLHLGFM